MSCRRLSPDEQAVLGRLAKGSLRVEDVDVPELEDTLKRLCAEGFVFCRGGSYQLAGLGYAHVEEATSRGILG